MDLEISDLPPPETVQGLWHSVPRGRAPTKPPGRSAGLFLHAQAETVGQHVGDIRAQRQLARFSVAGSISPSLRGR